MFNLAYMSTAAKRFTDGELFEMLDHWRAKNTQLGITGLLLYKEGAFVQTLEGEEGTIRALYAAIQMDERHFQVTMLEAKPIAKRRFPQWTMGFKRMEGTEMASVPGYNPHPNLPASEEGTSDKTTLAMQLLAQFAQDNEQAN